MLDAVEKYIAKEWGVLISAPISFVMAIAVVGLLVWSVARWHHAERVDTLNNRLSARLDEIEALKEKLTDAQSAAKKLPVEDHDDISQSGRVVGKMIGHDIRRGDGVVLAGAITASGDFDPQKPFAFRDMRLNLVDWTVESRANVSGMTTRKFNGTVSQILD